MSEEVEFEPFAGIILGAIATRSASKHDLERHTEHAAPRYVVRMCETLTQAIHAAGKQDATLTDLVRLESTCTGADYAYKFALRCHQLTLSVAK